MSILQMTKKFLQCECTKKAERFSGTLTLFFNEAFQSHQIGKSM